MHVLDTLRVAHVGGGPVARGQPTDGGAKGNTDQRGPGVRAWSDLDARGCAPVAAGVLVPLGARRRPYDVRHEPLCERGLRGGGVAVELVTALPDSGDHLSPSE